MSATVYNLTEAWSGTNRYTAGVVTDVYLSNPANEAKGVVAWTTTLDDNTPTVTPALANKIKPAEGVPMQLSAGERLWMASFGQPNAHATLEL